jgi:NTP pyrophosphatase (non-canonical NTP hydrolase)
MKHDSLDELTGIMRRFVEERHWQAYQTPKNLAMALCGEAGELAAELQWLTQEESRCPDEDKKRRVASEMADVLLYLIRMADEMDIDLIEAAFAKCEANARKYPEDMVRGTLRLRDEYEEK